MIRLPYGHGSVSFDETGTTVLRSRVSGPARGASGERIVREAMAKPYGGTPLRELAKGKKTCTLIISDHTRPVPSREILPAMLEELRRGSPGIAVTLLVATGCHRGTTRTELTEKLGEQIVSAERIAVHDAFDAASNVYVGELPSGAPLVLDRLAAGTDLLIAEGFIEPHFFAGFSGGRKSVLPGVSECKTVLGNHCGRFIGSPFARAGILENNPIHMDMAAAAELAKLRYIVNVVVGEDGRTAAAFAGEPAAAHAAGCAYLRPLCEVSAGPADIVITSNGGAPLDQNVYQCVKGLTAAEAASKEGGVLILCAECADGVGGEGIYRLLKECESPRALYERLMAVPRGQTVPDQWQSQILARVLMARRAILVTRPELETSVREMKMDYAPSLQEAFVRARRIKGKGASVTVMPDGVSVIVKPQGAPS